MMEANNSSSSSPCDDILWSLANCTIPDADPCCTPPVKETTIGVIRSTVYVVIAAVGVLGNFVNILALPYARKHCRDVHSPLLHSTTVLVISLSTCDLIFCVCCVINATITFTHGWPHGQVSCTILAFFLIMSNTVSLITLGIMAINRCLGVWFPRVCGLIFDSMKGLPAVLFIWVVAIAECAPFVHVYMLFTSVQYSDKSRFYRIFQSEVYGYLGYNPLFGYCTFVDAKPIRNLYKYLITAYNSIAPMIFIFVSSILIYVKVRRSRTLVQTTGSASSDVFRKRERKLTAIFATISAIYVVCVTPFILVVSHLGPENYESTALFLAGICYALNFSINFILYALRVPAYRAAYLLFFGKVAQMGRSSSARVKKNCTLVREGLVSGVRRISNAISSSSRNDAGGSEKSKDDSVTWRSTTGSSTTLDTECDSTSVSANITSM